MEEVKVPGYQRDLSVRHKFELCRSLLYISLVGYVVLMHPLDCLYSNYVRISMSIVVVYN
jgi:hypothetical protein